MLRSALLCLRSLLVSRSVNLELSGIDLDIEKGQATDNAILFSSFLVMLFTLENSFFKKNSKWIQGFNWNEMLFFNSSI